VISLGRQVLKQEDIAFKAALLYLFNHSLVYQLALQSETTYTCLTLIGLLIMYYRVNPQSLVDSVPLHRILAGTFVFGANVLTRAQGLLMLPFVGMVLVKKIIARSDRFFKTFKYLFFTVWIVLIFVLSFAMVTYWKPYVMHCETKLDRTDAVPAWCF